ncbi:MAG: terpene cyclase/mutase family protein [Planctomycetes bacterium]|nr:terpene cyclase/mutase family protein [Planctomycetota bacterium]
MSDPIPQETPEGFMMGRWLEEQVRNTPWWLISIAFHLIVLAGMTVVTFKEEIKAADSDKIVIHVPPQVDKYNLPPPSDVIPSRDTGAPLFDDPSNSANDDPVIVWEEAEPSDHNESDEGIDGHTMEGQREDFLSGYEGTSGGLHGRSPHAGPGLYDSMGVGGGGGDAGRFGNGPGGRRNLRKTGFPGGTGATRDSENAVMNGLRWLARHQGPSGAWSGEAFHAQCSGSKCSGEGHDGYDAGQTGLALLAFLGAGYTHLTKETYVDKVSGKTICWGTVIKNAAKWLMENQDAEGCYGGQKGGKYMYNHAIAALAMAELYGLSNANIFKDTAQKGVDFVLQAQNPYKAWRYTKVCRDNDTSVTGWAVMALKSADMSGLAVGRTGYEGALGWVREVTDEAYYKVGYTAKGTPKIVVAGKNEDWENHEAMTAVGMLIRIFTEHDKADPALAGGAKLMMGDTPVYGGKKTDYYYWYYASLALFQLDGPDGQYWNAWNKSMVNALVPSQRGGKDGCACGSWETDVDRWSFEGGRVYATAINVLTLEVYYRYESAFGGQNRGSSINKKDNRK